MSQTESYSKCLCQNCGGHIEFPAEGAGQTVNCPHCGGATLLIAGQTVPALRPTPRWPLLVGIIGVGLIAAAAVLYFAPRLNVHPAPPMPSPRRTNSPTPAMAKPIPPPDLWHGLNPGPVQLEKSSAGNLVYAVGEVRNGSDHERFGVRVELDVLDKQNEKVGSASDYTQSILAGKTWRFRALVTDRSGVAAQITTIKED